MTREQRLEVYTRDLTYKTVDGIYRLTPAQRRRLFKKERSRARKAESKGS